MYQRTKMDDQFTDWHSVRPGHPTLSLSVREITSVSVTFILSSPYSASDPANPDLASLGLSSSDDDDQSRDSSSTTDTTQSQVVSDILAKGLSVKVNGTPWKRVILKMDDMLDEAVIILYGLMPARQYDIELGILPGQASVRSQITTGTYVLHLFTFSAPSMWVRIYPSLPHTLCIQGSYDPWLTTMLRSTGTMPDH